MEGFLQLHLKPWVRRLLTRSIAIIPAALVAALGGDTAAGRLLVLSQVILSFTLVFAVVPLIQFTSSRAKMGSFVNGWPTCIVATFIGIILSGLNIYLVVESIQFHQFGPAKGGGGPV
jgi:Mn2+/Fe2+ NRAMP family transporter